MVTVKDIIKAVKKQVTAGLANTEYKDIIFSSTDITEEIVRPSFYTDIGTENKTGMATNRLKERTIDINLFYFSKELKSNRIDLLTMQGYLEDIFLDGFVVNESFYFGVDETSFEMYSKDGYMIATIQLYSLEEIEIVDNSEEMGELELKMEG